MDEESLALAGIATPSTIPADAPAAAPAASSTPKSSAKLTTKSTGKKTARAKPGAKRKSPYTFAPRSDRLRKRLSSTSAEIGEAIEEIAVEMSIPVAHSPAAPGRGNQSAPTSTAHDPPRSAAQAGPFEEFKKYMDEQFLALKRDIKADVTGSVDKLSEQVKANSENIRRLDGAIEKKVAELVGKEMPKVTKEVDKMKAIKETSSLAPTSTRNSDDETKYWRARRSVRCWPIPGRNDLWGNTGDFFSRFLMIPPANLTQDCVEDVRKLCSTRYSRSKIKDEV